MQYHILNFQQSQYNDLANENTLLHHKVGLLTRDVKALQANSAEYNKVKSKVMLSPCYFCYAKQKNIEVTPDIIPTQKTILLNWIHMQEAAIVKYLTMRALGIYLHCIKKA